MTAIPHLSLAGTGSPAGLRRLAADLAAAYSDVGFAYVTDHGVPAAVTGALFEASRRFHALPQAEKDAVAVNRHHRGYIGPETATDRASSVEAATRPNLSESFIKLSEAPPGRGATWPLDGPNRWPDLPGFREGGGGVRIRGGTGCAPADPGDGPGPGRRPEAPAGAVRIADRLAAPAALSAPPGRCVGRPVRQCAAHRFRLPDPAGAGRCRRAGSPGRRGRLDSGAAGRGRPAGQHRRYRAGMERRALALDGAPGRQPARPGPLFDRVFLRSLPGGRHRTARRTGASRLGPAPSASAIMSWPSSTPPMPTGRSGTGRPLPVSRLRNCKGRGSYL